ncbi:MULTISPECIES: helix-turn-helix transcriptional regulator [unclassified Dehalobacter]|uniref:helix-turn-helix transcriptional regulator n=1 Tax=unclassified Dehalobacter TaxID=2635733 RepID=UPI00037D698C|nr:MULTISPECIES: helix-turn-helix transcriptional regulator [unclassified Dehalobacter]RJE47133.1 transcriptional regulator [Dehalobacter sp. MCB1]TCX53705.1 transcriptional regulator [Dehalobacter sp. 14DCB1]TCX55008.1 transcriptional regulator [Dehalobacter sp. 12DCB1]
MQLSERQEKILELVKKSSPMTGEQIASQLNLNRATLRPDLTILTMAGVLEARPRVGYFYNGNTGPSPIAQRVRQLRVGDFKSIAAAVKESISIYDAVVSMFTNNVGSLIVINNERELKGMVSRKDILKASLGNMDLHGVPISVIMTRMPNIIMAASDESVLEAARKLVLHQIDTLPVVESYINEEGRESFEVVGRFTKTNVTNLFVELGQEKFPNTANLF